MACVSFEIPKCAVGLPAKFLLNAALCKFEIIPDCSKFAQSVEQARRGNGEPLSVSGCRDFNADGPLTPLPPTVDGADPLVLSFEERLRLASVT